MRDVDHAYRWQDPLPRQPARPALAVPAFKHLAKRLLDRCVESEPLCDPCRDLTVPSDEVSGQARSTQHAVEHERYAVDARCLSWQSARH